MPRLLWHFNSDDRATAHNRRSLVTIKVLWRSMESSWNTVNRNCP